MIGRLRLGELQMKCASSAGQHMSSCETVLIVAGSYNMFVAGLPSCFPRCLKEGGAEEFGLACNVVGDRCEGSCFRM